VGVGVGVTALAGSGASDPVVTSLAGFAGGRRPTHAVDARRSRPLSGRAGGLPTHPGRLLDAPQGPSESSQGYYLLFFRFAQDVAHANEGYCLASESTSPSLILVGRFWVTAED
jgi:hypothetical protein